MKARRTVATTAAPLTGPARARLEAAFGAPVHDEYRGSEFGWMAGECARRDGLHVLADARRIEVVREDGSPAEPGETGDLVITDLRNRVFDLIRYPTGDRGILRAAPCPCGRSLPMIEARQGRTIDVLHLPSGAALAHRLTAMFSAHPEAVRLFPATCRSPGPSRQRRPSAHHRPAACDDRAARGRGAGSSAARTCPRARIRRGHDADTAAQHPQTARHSRLPLRS